MITFSLEFWIILAAICLLLELITGGFYLMSVGVGGIAATISNYMGFDPITQLIFFAVFTIIFLIISRPLAKKLTKGSPSKKATTDRFIGQKGMVIEAIDSENSGMIKISGELWRARSEDSIDVGEEVVVSDVKGVRLIVKKVDEK